MPEEERSSLPRRLSKHALWLAATVAVLIVLDADAKAMTNCGYNFGETIGDGLSVVVGSVIFIPMTMLGTRAADWTMMALVLAGFEIAELLYGREPIFIAKAAPPSET